MAENSNSISFFADLMGKPDRVELSTDGKAINTVGQIAMGIPISMTIRPSSSKGQAVDVNIDGTILRHCED